MNATGNPLDGLKPYDQATVVVWWWQLLANDPNQVKQINAQLEGKDEPAQQVFLLKQARQWMSQQNDPDTQTSVVQDIRI